MKNTTGNPKYNLVSKDPRILTIRPATLEESEGDRTAVMVELVEGFTHGDSDRFLAFGVADCRDALSEVEASE
jgi:hypothetical protein